MVTGDFLWMERSLFGFIIRYSKRDQLLIVPLVVASMVVYYLSLDLPKTIINQAIQGVSFPAADSVKRFLGLDLERIPYLFALSVLFLGLIVLNGWLKFQINTMKGWMGERMLRRLRFALFDYILRFPLTRFRRIKPAEMATMVKDEVEPLGGFIGEALITPLFLGGQALTAMAFILYQHWVLGLVALSVVAVQAFIIPRLRRRQLVLGRERQLTARALAGRIAECVEGAAEIHAHDTSNYERAEISARLGRIFRIRFELYQRKFMVKFLNNFLAQVPPFLFRTLGGASELAPMLARLGPPTNGTIEMGGVDITRAPEAMTGRALAYVGSPAYLFPVSVRENIIYGLKHRPVREAGYDEEVKRERAA